MAGQAYAVYWRMDVKKLNQLRSKKHLELNALAGKGGLFAERDRSRLTEQIRVIDVVRAQKLLQIKTF